MVQIINPSPRAMQAGQIGQALGLGVGKNFPDPQQLVQKKQLSEAFKQFQSNVSNKEATPLDLSMNFLEAIAGIPGAERYAGQVLPLILQEAKTIRAAQTPGPGQNLDQPQTAQPKLNDQNPQQLDLPPPEIQAQNIFDESLEPTKLGMGPLPGTYSPQQIRQLETEDLLAGFPDSPRAQRAKEHNEIARQETRDYIQAAQAQSTISQQRRDSQEAFRTTLKSMVGNDPTTLTLAENIANKPEYRNISNDQIRADKVKKEVDLISKNLEGFRTASNRPNPYLPWSRSSYDKNFEALRKNVQPLISEGLRPQVNEILTKNGWSKTEVEQILNPLGKDVINEIKLLPDVTPTSYTTAGGGQPFAKEDRKFIEEKNKKWEKYLEKTIKPGKTDPTTRDTIQPGTSLVLLQNEYMKKGGNWEDFEQMINNLRSTEKIKLDKFQNDEMNIINQRPINRLTIEEFLLGTKSL